MTLIKRTEKGEKRNKRERRKEKGKRKGKGEEREGEVPVTALLRGGRRWSSILAAATRCSWLLLLLPRAGGSAQRYALLLLSFFSSLSSPPPLLLLMFLLLPVATSFRFFFFFFNQSRSSIALKRAFKPKLHLCPRYKWKMDCWRGSWWKRGKKKELMVVPARTGPFHLFWPEQTEIFLGAISFQIWWIPARFNRNETKLITLIKLALSSLLFAQGN